MYLPLSPISILPAINKMVPYIMQHCLRGGEVKDHHVEWSYTVYLQRDGEPTTLPTHCTPSNEERGDVFGPLQNKWGIFKEKLLD